MNYEQKPVTQTRRKEKQILSYSIRIMSHINFSEQNKKRENVTASL